MLIYTPIFDINHTIFRFLQILQKSKRVHFDKLRILDFYLIFPNLLLNASLPIETNKFRHELKNMLNPYEVIVDEKRIFNRMEPFQKLALNCLLAYDLVTVDHENNHLINFMDANLPADLNERLKKRNSENGFVINILTEILVNLDLNGPSGLKARTKLIEYKYDVN
ncbi:MAG: hypothetical protein A2068_12285 [Ignavibacteria bacterium GWB2_35_6b]|nr:MAG: hypothetical protein A2068_12285 [Ignavibacteria bacterium GWB2_35_6b]